MRGNGRRTLLCDVFLVQTDNPPSRQWLYARYATKDVESLIQTVLSRKDLYTIYPSIGTLVHSSRDAKNATQCTSDKPPTLAPLRVPILPPLQQVKPLSVPPQPAAERRLSAPSNDSVCK